MKKKLKLNKGKEKVENDFAQEPSENIVKKSQDNPKSKSLASINLLPNEILLYMFSFLDLDSLLSCLKVNKNHHSLIINNFDRLAARYIRPHFDNYIIDLSAEIPMQASQVNPTEPLQKIQGITAQYKAISELRTLSLKRPLFPIDEEPISNLKSGVEALKSGKLIVAAIMFFAFILGCYLIYVTLLHSDGKPDRSLSPQPQKIDALFQDLSHKNIQKLINMQLTEKDFKTGFAKYAEKLINKMAQIISLNKDLKELWLAQILLDHIYLLSIKQHPEYLPLSRAVIYNQSSEKIKKWLDSAEFRDLNFSFVNARKLNSLGLSNSFTVLAKYAENKASPASDQKNLDLPEDPTTSSYTSSFSSGS